MIGFEPDWRYLRPALTALAAASLLIAAMLAFSTHALGRAQEAYGAKSAERSRLNARYQAAKSDKLLIDRYLRRYRQLVERGAVGNEKRLVWVDALRAEAKALKLPLMRYQISPREPFSADYVRQVGGFSVGASRMKLDLGLLHEGDLLQLLDDLERQVPAAFHIKGCRLRRAEPRFDYYPDRPNLNADCELLWFSLTPSGETGGKTG